MKKQYVLVVLLLAAFTLASAAESICNILNSFDGSLVRASGYVRELDVKYDSYANFKIYDGTCWIHVYWNFAGTPPNWLKDGAYVIVEGKFWKEHEKHWWEPEIEASYVVLAEPEDSHSKGIASSAAWTVTFWGAAGEVAGSCYQLTTSEESFLVDCGSFMNTDDMPVSQRGTTNDCDPFPFDPAQISDLIITHAHDDHTGRIHYLVARGFTGEIHMTAVTAMIYREKLEDTLAYCCMPEAQATTAGVAILGMIVEHDYGETFEVNEEAHARFIDAGHIPGSASVSIEFDTPYGVERVVLSGDVGSGRHPFLNPPDLESVQSTGATTLIIESTYGSSDAREYPDDLYAEFFEVVQDCVDDGKLVVIPTFALDRTQRVLAALLEGVRDGRLVLSKPIGVGGKSSYYLTELYRNMWRDASLSSTYFSASFLMNDPFLGNWGYVRLSPGNAERETPEYAFNFDVVVSPSGTGMTSYTRELIDAFEGNSRVAFIQVGWSPSWTPLGELADSEQLHNVHDVFSGHADVNTLIEYAASLEDLERVVITHGDDGIKARLELADALRRAISDIEVIVPVLGDSLSIID